MRSSKWRLKRDQSWLFSVWGAGSGTPTRGNRTIESLEAPAHLKDLTNFSPLVQLLLQEIGRTPLNFSWIWSIQLWSQLTAQCFGALMTLSWKLCWKASTSSGSCVAHSSAWLLFSDDSMVTSFAILAQYSAKGFTSRALVQTEVGSDDIFWHVQRAQHSKWKVGKVQRSFYFWFCLFCPRRALLPLLWPKALCGILWRGFVGYRSWVAGTHWTNLFSGHVVPHRTQRCVAWLDWALANGRGGMADLAAERCIFCRSMTVGCSRFHSCASLSMCYMESSIYTPDMRRDL